jgi:hypothetical protein
MVARSSGFNQIGDKVLLHVVDCNLSRAFLVDMGSEVSLLSAIVSDKRTSGKGSIPLLVAANGLAIKIYVQKNTSTQSGRATL